MVFVSNNKNSTEQQITLPEKTEAEIQAENDGKALLEANREAMQKAKPQVYQPVKEIDQEDSQISGLVVSSIYCLSFSG